MLTKATNSATSCFNNLVWKHGGHLCSFL